jgi:UDP:flavonoid glycosyltransferase YjiC (YdhE family)
MGAMRVLVVAPPFAGHLDRLVPLIQAAQGVGHTVRVLTGHARLSFLRACGIDAFAPPSLTPGALERIAEGFGRISGRPHAALAQLRANLRLLPALTDDLCNEIGRWRADVLVADSVALMAAPAASRTGVPWITTVASPLSLHTTAGTPPFFGGWTPPHGWLGRARDALGRTAHKALRKAVFALHHRQLPPELNYPFRDDGTETIYSPDAILGFGMLEFEFPRSWPPSFEMIGPVASAPTLDPPLLLPRAKRSVFATLGTHLPWARAGWREGLARIASDRPDWVIVASDGRMEGGSVVSGGPPNLHIVPRVCYQRDLPRFNAVIHHGGTGITYSTIAAGLPSLVVPHDFDQFDVAARIVWHGLGLRTRSLLGATQHLEQLMAGGCPALHGFRDAAARYAPEARFLATLNRVTESA